MKTELKRELFYSAKDLCNIDDYYWETLGDIIYQQHLKSLYKARKTAEV